MDTHSRELFQEACALMPGGVNSPVRACKNVDSFPIFISRAYAAHLVDVDDNDYVDFVLSWGPMILGHTDADVLDALKSSIAKGTSYGAPCPAEVALAREIISAMPGVEMIRMVNSGTEATMSAIRLARGVTGRNKILKFTGCYHGHADAFLAAAGSGVATFSIPGTPGVPESVVRDTLLSPYNDLHAVTEQFSRHGKDIAAVIVEPVAANMGLVPPIPGFLQGLRQLCDEYRSLLVFDEVITGFRLAYGGAQQRFNIVPDLTTLGKIIGGGLPVGAFGGKKEYMQNVAPSGSVYQAGTLSGNPLAMAAGIATLRKLKTLDYAALEKRTAEFAREMADILRGLGVEVQMPTVASMFCPFFSASPVANFEQAQKCDQKRFADFYRQMRAKGIYLAPSGFETGFTSFAHTEHDFAKTLDAVKSIKF